MPNTQIFASTFLQDLANAAECEHWHCHELPDGQHNENCLNHPDNTQPDTCWCGEPKNTA